MNARHTVLVVDDEASIRKLITTALARADYATLEAAGGREAMDRVRNSKPDIVLLDLGLPDRDGLELVPLIKQQADATLIVVSARDATDEKVAALDLGADDYLTKPFDTEELLARVRVALRNRTAREGGSMTVTAGDLEIDLVNRRVTRSGVELSLTPKEYIVLAQLAKFPGRVVTHKQIMDEAWPREAEHHVEYLRVLIRSLRNKIEPDPQRPSLITNAPGVGYRFNSD